MRFRSTRDAKLTAAFGEALTQGLAPDGGLYVPVEWPRFSAGTWDPWGSLAKFREIVEPLIGREVPVPQSLARLFARPTARTEIEADLDSLRDALREDPT